MTDTPHVDHVAAELHRAAHIVRTRALSEARDRLHAAAAAQRPNTARHTHYSEAADIVHKMISE